MTRSQARAIWLACAGAVTACTPTPPPAAISTISAGPVCRVGPDGGPLVAERGIGGTGSPATQLAERGIGGTGIIGVVTGFASICLAGHEVALPAGVPIEIGGAVADQRALRAGQVAAVEAGGPPDALYARRVTVRYEVQGPVETVAQDRLQVAGQTVLLSSDTWLRIPPALGQWVAVSGLRDGTGAIAATRLDLVSTRTFIVHGIVQQDAGGYRIGTVPVVGQPGDVLVPGLPVSITGVYGEGVLRAQTIAPDLLAADPTAYFGDTTNSFIVEGFGTQAFLQAPASSNPIGPGRNVVEFQRTGGGGIRIDSIVPRAAVGESVGRFQQAPTSSREGPGRAGSARGFEPAPMPNRSPGFGAAPGDSGALKRDGFGALNRFGDGAGRGPGSRAQPGGTQGGSGDMNGPGPGFGGGSGNGGGRRP